MKYIKQKQKNQIYTVMHDSKVHFGKHRGSSHLALSNDTVYCNWLLQNSDPAFAIETKAYLKSVGY